MVVALGPGKFYGSSLPRPRYYDKEDRVDPPTPVLDPFLSWANEAHWSMGGLSFKRLRLQGKIEGNIEKLRKEQEKKDHHTPISKSKVKSSKGKKWIDSEDDDSEDDDSAPPAPISKKTRRRWAAMVDEEDDEASDVSSDEESEKEVVMKKRRRLVRKLGDDFEMVATDNVETISDGAARRTRGRRSMVLAEDDDESDGGEKSEAVKSGKINGRKAPVSPKKVSKKTDGGSARSSPRLKRKSS